MCVKIVRRTILHTSIRFCKRNLVPTRIGLLAFIQEVLLECGRGRRQGGMHRYRKSQVYPHRGRICSPGEQSRPTSSESSRAAGAASPAPRARRPMSAPLRSRAARPPARAPRHLSRPRPHSGRPPLLRAPFYFDLLNTIGLKFNFMSVFINRAVLTTVRRRPRAPSESGASPGHGPV